MFDGLGDIAGDVAGKLGLSEDATSKLVGAISGAGIAVAGNIGAEARFEYTVIGDPVNEAARLCELAKGRPERVIASGRTLEAARPEEAANWRLGEQVTLRGRPAETTLALPVTEVAAGT